LEKKYNGEVICLKFDSTRYELCLQQFALLPWLTVFKTSSWACWPKLARKRPARYSTEELRQLGLRNLHMCSRKTSQADAPARGDCQALATDPKIILWMNRFRSLISFTAEELRKELLEIWKTRKQRSSWLLISSGGDRAGGPHRGSEFPPSANRKSCKEFFDSPSPDAFHRFFALEDHLYQLIRP